MVAILDHKEAVPFTEVHQLNTDLFIPDSNNENGGLQENAKCQALPGYPSITLGDGDRLKSFLTSELCTPDLNRMAPKLWMMSTWSGANINPLHHQLVKGRIITVSESPRLHLVWARDRIYLKPLPKYLLSHAFWTHVLLNERGPISDQAEREQLLRSARGFLRSYFYLIKYESDFNIARDGLLRLVPSTVTWEQFCSFSSRLDLIDDSVVTPRYTYGELRLTRLNFYAKFLLLRFQYEYIHREYSAFFARFYGHLLFIFAILSIMLNAMQVQLAVDQVADDQWNALWDVWRYFSIICLVCIIIVLLALVCLLGWLFADEWIYAITAMRRKRRLQSATWFKTKNGLVV